MNIKKKTGNEQQKRKREPNLKQRKREPTVEEARRQATLPPQRANDAPKQTKRVPFPQIPGTGSIKGERTKREGFMMLRNLAGRVGGGGVGGGGGRVTAGTRAATHLGQLLILYK